MFDITIKANIKNKEAIKLLKSDIRTSLIESGLDEPIKQSIVKLKQELKDLINGAKEQPKESKPNSDSKHEDDILPKSDKELIKYLTGMDLDKIRSTKDYTSSVESGIILINSNRTRLRFTIGDYEGFDENLLRAKQFFNTAIFVSLSGTGKVRYLLNPGIDLSQYVKVVCSRQAGDTPMARAKFEKYKNSKRMTRQIDSEHGRFAEWALLQEGVKRITGKNSGFIDLTDIIQDIKEGKADSALTKIRASNQTDRLTDISKKIENIKENKDLTPDIQSYMSLIQTINNIKARKEIRTGRTDYFLEYSVNSTDQDSTDKFLDELESQISLWLVLNEKTWIEFIVKLARQIIKKYV